MDPNMLVAYLSLGVMAVTPIIVGSFKSLKPNDEVESIRKKDAQLYPIYGSAVLFGLYLVFKFVPKEIINMIITGYFGLFGTYSLSDFLYSIISSYLFQIRPKGDTLKFDVSFGKKSLLLVNLDWCHFVTIGISIALSVYYAMTKNWIANNLFGVAFSTVAIELIHLDSFITGMILLSGLFFYDIFWVFGTEVMVAVAKSFDAPIKLVFPKSLFAETLQFTMLGLGDIVMPGIFIALALRFDRSLSKNTNSFSKPYFTACMIFYILGLVATVFVMHTFQAAQPALLYLSPACILSVLITALSRGELKKLLEYNPEEQEKNAKNKKEKQ